MGILDPIGIAASLARLVASPRVQYGVNQFKNTLPSMSGPFGGSQMPKIGPSRTGAASKQSSQYGQGGVGSNFGASVGSILAKMGTQQQDPLMSLYEQLISQLQSPVDMPTGIDTEDLMNQVKRAINPIYDQRAKAAKTQSAANRKDVQGMYGALADDYERLAPQQIAQANAAKEEIEQLYGSLRSNVEGNYSRVAKEQGELFKELGIEAALPEVLGEQDDAVLEATNAAAENQAQQEQRYMDMGQIDSTYYREGSPIATMAGNEISTDMLTQLQSYLEQVEAERSSGIQSAYGEQLGQAQSSLAQQQQAAQSEAARRQEMLWQVLQSQMSNNNQTAALTPDTFMSQLPAQTQQQVAGAFTRLQRSPEAVYGKVEDKRNPVPGSFVETTDQWYMAQADEMLKRGEIDPVTHQALLQYMQIYFGNGK